MSGNRTGTVEALTLLAPLRVGAADAARAAVTALDAGRASPFADVPGTHLVRVQVVRPPARRFRGSPSDYLLLAADVDAPLRRWLREACLAIPDQLDALLAHCAFWPGASRLALVEPWVERHRLPVGFSVIGSPQAPVARVREALVLRERLRQLVIDTQGATPAAQHDAWRRWNGG